MAADNVNKIGIFEFISLRGIVEVPQEESVINFRPGIDDADISLVGIQMRPFNLESRVNEKNMDQARRQFLKYVKLVGGDTIDLIKDGFEYKNHLIKFFVKHVSLKTATARVTASGGIAGKAPNEAFLVCDWTLLASPITPE